MPRFSDGSAAIVFDDSALPILIASSFGAATEKLVREAFAWLRAFAVERHARRERWLTIIDARGAARPPAPVRNLISELTDEIRTAAPDGELASLFVMESALIRGALTAIMWVSRSSWKPIIVASWPEALRRAEELLRAANLDVPRLPERIHPPA